MKKTLIFITALALTVLTLVTSCQKDLFHFVKGTPVKFGITSSGSSLTRAAYSNEDLKGKTVQRIDWKKNDRIRIYCDASSDVEDGKYADYKVTKDGEDDGDNISSATVVSYDGKELRWGTEGVDHMFYAVYPSPGFPSSESPGITVSIKDNVVTGNLPSTDQGKMGDVKKSDGNYVVTPDLKWMMMTAKAGPFVDGMPDDEVLLKFQPLTTAIEFTIYNGNRNAALDINRVLLISKNTQISGTFTVDIDTPDAANSNYPTCAGTLPGSREVCINMPSGISLAEATGDGTANCKSLKFTFFLAPTTDVSDLTFKLYKSKTAWMQTRLGYTDGSGVEFPCHKKSFVEGLIVPEGVQWTVKYGPDVQPWNTSDDPIKPMPEIGGRTAVTSWDTGIDGDLSLEPKENNDLLPGKFSVSATEYVQFSKGNLFCTDKGSGNYEFSFEEKQYYYRCRSGLTGDKAVLGDPGATTTPQYTSGLFQWIPRTSGSAAADWGAFTSNNVNPDDTFKDVLDFGGVFPGSDWTTLTGVQWKYLLDNHTNKFVTVIGVNGLAIAPDDYEGEISASYTTLEQWAAAEAAGIVFLPIYACYITQLGKLETSELGYWSSSPNALNKNYATALHFYGTSSFNVNERWRVYGQNVRLVQKFPKSYVKIGDLYIATTNIGASSPKDYGWYFFWGGTTGYIHKDSKWVMAADPTVELSGGFNWKNAPFNNGNSDYDGTYFSSVCNDVCPEGVLAPGYDAAHVNLGGIWRMPTADDFKNLYNACGGTGTSCEPSELKSSNPSKGIYWVTAGQHFIEDYNGVTGLLFCDGTSMVFFPAAGYGDGNNFKSEGTDGIFWSSSLAVDHPKAYGLGYYSTYIDPQFSYDRIYGRTIRPVHD